MSDTYYTNLIAAAKVAANTAYAPYSNFRVGAALMTASGEIFTGCNIENASYGLTICAERVAIFKARSSGFSEWKAIAIFAPQEPAPTPCGACRQVMSEGKNSPIVIVVGSSGKVQTYAFEELLPHPFNF
ncbi:cytidine deaminase [bacterium]|nr:cytidine deaminase [bacterium]